MQSSAQTYRKKSVSLEVTCEFEEWFYFQIGSSEVGCSLATAEYVTTGSKRPGITTASILILHLIPCESRHFLFWLLLLQYKENLSHNNGVCSCTTALKTNNNKWYNINLQQIPNYLFILVMYWQWSLNSQGRWLSYLYGNTAWVSNSFFWGNILKAE